MNRHLLSLYLYYGVYFTGLGFMTYAPKYYGAIGLTNAQIGLISAVPAFIAIFVQPLWGMLSDRSAYKKNTIIFGILVAALCAFAAERLSGHYAALLTVLTLLSVFTLHAVPVGSAISLEYTAREGKKFGPIRLTGTVGYQVGILIIGQLLSESLRGLYTVYGAVLLLSALAAFMMPPVRGHQHGEARVSVWALFGDKRIVGMLVLAFLVQTMAQFYLSFFSKYLGELGMSNAVTGLITILSVFLEIPFLLVGDRLYKKLPIFKWMWIGLLLNALRFVGMSYARTPLAMIVTLLPCVFLLASFEFFPAIYLSTAMPKELSGTAQNVYQTVTYGVARIAGAMLGGILADAIGIDGVFFYGGMLLLIVSAATFFPIWRAKR
ncbi:MAG: MFS transporter [Clostridia bacterium]|nr:MFS transporter [Clostridia bacterium]